MESIAAYFEKSRGPLSRRLAFPRYHFSKEFKRKLISVIREIHFAPATGATAHQMMEKHLEERICITWTARVTEIKNMIKPIIPEPYFRTAWDDCRLNRSKEQGDLM